MSTDLDYFESEYSDEALTGARNTLPVVSDKPAQGAFSSFRDLMGSVGTIARDVGTTVGTVRRDLKNAEDQIRGAAPEYRTAQRNAYTGNRVGQWWQYATMTDKVIVGLAVLTLGVAIYQVAKK